MNSKTLLITLISSLSLSFLTGCEHATVSESREGAAALAALNYDGSQTALDNLNKQINEAGLDTARKSALIADLVTVLNTPKLTFDAQQTICQKLGYITLTDADIERILPAVSPLLLNLATVNNGLLALVPISSSRVDRVFIDALNHSEGELKVALVQALARRKQVSATNDLIALINDGDKAISDAAIYALGEIGTREALTGLSQAKNQSNHYVVDAKIAIAWKLSPQEGSDILNQIYLDKSLTESNRAAALRGLLNLQPEKAKDRIVDALMGSSAAYKKVCLESLYSSQVPNLKAAVLDHFSSYDPVTQCSVIAVMGKLSEVGARSVTEASLSSEVDELRLAALGAIANIPSTPKTVQILAELAAKASGDELRAAKYAIARLQGEGISEAVLELSKSGSVKQKVFCIEAIGARNMTQAVPDLLAMRKAKEIQVRVAALDALGDLASVGLTDPIYAWTLGSKEGQELTHAKRTLFKILQLENDSSLRGVDLIIKIKAGDAVTQLKLMSLLPKLDSEIALACAKQLALSDKADVSSEAISTLETWSDAGGLVSLVEISEDSKNPSVRSLALESALRVVDLERTTPAKEKSDLLIRLFQCNLTIEQKNSVLYRLGRGVSAKALSFAESLASDVNYGVEAKSAAEEIRANKLWPATLISEANTRDLHNMVDGNFKSSWTAPTASKPSLTIDLKAKRIIRQIVLDERRDNRNYPQSLEVYITDDLDQLGTPVVVVKGTIDATIVNLPKPYYSRYIILKGTSKNKDANWSITELHVD